MSSLRFSGFWWFPWFWWFSWFSWFSSFSQFSPSEPSPSPSICRSRNLLNPSQNAEHLLNDFPVNLLNPPRRAFPTRDE